jgi:uncharacterized protein (TIGR02466 family)
MFIDLIYSKPICGKVLDIDTKKIVSVVEDLYEKDFNTITNPGYDMPKALKVGRTDNLNVLDEPMFEDLRLVIKKEFDSFAKNLMRYKNDFEFTTSWFTKSTKGQSSSFHGHANSMWTGCLYLQVDDNSGDIVFENFDHGTFYLEVEEHNMMNSIRWNIKPVNGMIIFFPSEVYHKIAESKSDLTRYSLCFSFLPVGLIGNSGSDAHAKINVEK